MELSKFFNSTIKLNIILIISFSISVNSFVLFPNVNNAFYILFHLTLVKTASLVNRNDTIYSKLINLNAGHEDNIRKNMSAINERGLIGKVIDTTANNSRVILLTDPNLSISVKSISDGIFSLLTGKGDGKYLVSSFVKENKMPRLGDIVVTSGTAQIFPVDLLVGKVAKVEKNRFLVLPFVDFENIDYVQIVTSK